MKTKIIIGVVAVVVLMMALSAVVEYNSLASSREAIATAEADIATVMQRRADLIPNLIATVNSFTKHEEEIVKQITDARAAIASAQTPTERAEADTALTDSLDKLTVIVENYPELKSDATYVSLMDELAGSENRISVARRDYNTVVKNYNSSIVTFPGNIYAGIFGFEKADYFEAAAGADVVPDVAGGLN